MVRRLIRKVNGNVFLRNSVVLFAGTMLANLVNYLFHFIMGRMVEPSVYGEMESIVSLLTIVSVPGTAITMVATRYAAAAKAKGNPAESRAVLAHIDRGLIRYGVPFLLLALLLTPQVTRFLRTEHPAAVVFLWGMMFLSFFSAAASGMLSGWQRFFSIGAIQVVSSVFKLIFSVLFVWLGFRVSGIVGAFFLSGIVGYILSMMILRRMDASDREKESGTGQAEPTIDLSAIRSYAIPVLSASLALAMLGNTDMVLAKYHLPPELAGLYGALFIVSKTIFFAGGILSAVMFSMSSEEHEKNGETSGSDPAVFRHALSLSVAFCIGSVGFFALFPEFVLRVFFGDRYLAGVPYLGWFALAAGLYTLANFFLQYLLSVHRIGVAWAALAVAVVEAAAILFLATDMADLIRYTVVAQAASLLLGAGWYVKGRKMRYTGQMPGEDGSRGREEPIDLPL